MSNILDLLPCEILFKVLSYLGTYDLMRFCVAYGNSCFLKENTLIRSVNFSRRFDLQNLDLCALITKNLGYANIRILNINYLYWIPALQLRTLIQQLENLEVLHAIDTELEFNSQNIDKYFKLTELAINMKYVWWYDMPVELGKQFKSLSSLRLKILTWNDLKDSIFYKFFQEIQQLEELWIFEAMGDVRMVEYSRVVNSLTKLKKIVIKSDHVPFYNFESNNLFKTFERRRYGLMAEVIYEKSPSKSKDVQSTSATKESIIEKSLKMFEIFPQDLPCGPEQSKNFFFKQGIETMYFEELNFCNTFIWCTSKYIDAAIQILSSKNSTKLRKLRIRSCLFQTAETELPTALTSGFKWLRKQTQKKSTNHPFWAILENFKNLKELEIESCAACNGETILGAYFAIHIFENLQKLTFEVPSLMDGLFLKEVFMKCQDLQSLNITCVVRNEKFMSNLYQNLKYAINLRDFRLDSKEVTIDRLLDSFPETKKILRIFMQCGQFQFLHHASQSKPFYNFVKDNSQLILFLVVSKQQNNDIEKVLSSFRTRKSKVFYAKTFEDLRYFRHDHLAHDDIISNHTNISGINIDEF